MKYLFHITALSALLIFSCNPEPLPKEEYPDLFYTDYDVLPPITQEGKRTFGCLANGVVWVPRVELFVPWWDMGASLDEKDGTGRGIIECRLLNKETDDDLEILFGPTFFKEGIYYSSVLSSTGMKMRIGKERYKHNDKDSLYNWVRISRIDTMENIMSGEFQFLLYNIDHPNDTLKITEGRFDMRYYPE